MEDRKIESCIRASFEMLSEGAERNLLLCLAIFPGDFNGTSGTCRLHWFGWFGAAAWLMCMYE